MRQAAEKIALVGSEGSGKTCFLAGLRWLSSATEDTPFAISGRDQKSQEYLEKLNQALKAGHCPPPSHSIEELELNVSYCKSVFDIRVQDCQGEEFKHAAQSNNVDHPIIKNLLDSQYLIVCLDGECDVKNPIAHSGRLDALFTILHGHQDLFLNKKIVFLLTKADVTGIPRSQWSGAVSLEYLQAHNSVFAKKIDALQLDVSFFFVSSLGSDMQHGEKPDPYGYDQVFGWLGHKRAQIRVESFIRNHFRLMIATVLLAIGSIVSFVVKNCYYESQKVAAGDVTVTESEQLNALARLSVDDKTEVINSKLASFEEELDKSQSVSSLKNLYERISKYSEAGVSDELRRRIDGMSKCVADALEKLYVDSLKLCVENKNKEGFDKELSAYLADRYSSKCQMEEVLKLSEGLKSALITDDKIRIAALNVDRHISNRSILDSKLKMIDSFAQKLDDCLQEKRDMLQAVKDMRKLLSNGKYEIKFEQGGKLKKNDRDSYLRVKFGNRDNEGEYKVPEDKYAAGAEPTWGYSKLIDWKVNDKIMVDWKCNKSWWITTFLYASVEIDGDCFTLLKFLASRCELNAKNPNDFDGRPYLKVRCDDFPNADASRNGIEKFIVPGNYWEMK